MKHKEIIYKIITDIWKWLKEYSDLTKKDDWDKANEDLMNIYRMYPDEKYEKFARSLACAAWELVIEIAKENTK